MKKVLKTKSLILLLLVVVIAVTCTGIAAFLSSRIQYGEYHEATASPAAEPDLDVGKFAKIGYELKYLFAVDSFTDVHQVSTGKLVQYAFCYLYCGDECLVDLQIDGMKYRKTNQNTIKNMLYTLFAVEDIDVKESDLYNPGENIFEMWQPNYKSDVFFSTAVKKIENGYIIDATYYTDGTKQALKGKVAVTLGKMDDRYYIKAIG